jgi:hypothetical protein
MSTRLSDKLIKLSSRMHCQAISDLSKALEFEPNSSDILHERGTPFMFCKLGVYFVVCCSDNDC